MKRLLAASFAIVAIVMSLLVATPANAAPSLVIKTKHVAMSGPGIGRVQLQCTAKKTCTGSIWATSFGADGLRFSVKAKSTAYVNFKLSDWQDIPTDDRGFRHVTINAHGAQPVSATLENYKTARIEGSVRRMGGNVAVSDLEVQLWRVGTRDRMVSTHRVSIAEGGNFSFTVPTGANNTTSANYRIQIIGKQDGTRRTWWWRGGNGTFSGGAPHSAQATRFAVTRNADEEFVYVTNFQYSSIRGQITPVAANKEVIVYQRPAVWPLSSAGMRDLDVMSCADIVGRTKTKSDGSYEIGFVPVNASRQYIVKTSKSWWNGNQGTCHAAVNYRSAGDGSSTPGLLSLGASPTTKDINESTAGTKLAVAVTGYQGTSATANMDKWVTIREYSPGRAILSSDIIYQGTGRNHELGAGKYWVETGRRHGCSAWYDSRFKDNNGYFKGEDRAAEKWKAKNYRMYREHCRSYSAGAYKLVTLSGTGTSTVSLANTYGATVKGKITGPTKKSRIEVLVRLTATDGTRVYRTGLSNGSGNFTVTGLAPGKYTVAVNSDSWRGIRRGFTGKKTVTVKAGKTHSIGTIKFKG